MPIRGESAGEHGLLLPGQTAPFECGGYAKELSDIRLEELIQMGDMAGAFAHARDMMEIAREQGDSPLVRAYEKELAKLRSQGFEDKREWW